MSIVSVFPLANLPRQVGLLDYRLAGGMPDPLPGSAVLVPLRGKREVAIVRRVKKTSRVPAAKLRDAFKAISGPLVSPERLALYEKFAKFYAISPGRALKAGLPQIPRQGRPFARPRDLAAVKDAAQPEFWLYNDREILLKGYAQKLAEKRPTLLVCPTKEEAEYLWGFATHQCPGARYADSTLRASELYRLYVDFLAGRIPALIGTSKVLFWHCLGPYTLILHNAPDPNHKRQDQAPRFDSATAFALMAEKPESCQLIASGPSVPLSLSKLKVRDLKTARGHKVRIVAPGQGKDVSPGAYVQEGRRPYSVSLAQAHAFDEVVAEGFDLLAQGSFYNSWELAHHSLASLKLLLKKEGGTLVVPTATPEHPVLVSEDFASAEIASRESLGLPPARKLLKIALPASKKAEDFLKKVRQAAPDNALLYKISLGQGKKELIALIPLKSSRHEEALLRVVDQAGDLKVKIDMNPLFLV